MMNRRAFLATLAAGALLPRDLPGLLMARPRPAASQLAWQQDEFALFLHFGVNTFTDREWGDGKEDPASFAPANLDARQWTRAAQAAGARALILTAKHHDGFCLWPTRTTEHSVAKSPFRNGTGDVVREFVDACRAARLKAGLYLSPWDRNSALYGDSPRYNDFYCAQLTELLTNYGPISEVWFDGANGEGPNGKHQQYDWPRFFALVRKLQPHAVIFSDAGPDVRWCGNENGSAGDPNWSTVDPAAVPYPGADGPNIIGALQHGDPSGSVWRPAEADVSIRPGWFYHPAEDERVRSIDNLVDLYFSSVGRNGKLLLNVPPSRDGLLHETDVARLTGMREKLNAAFANDLAGKARRTWTGAGHAAYRLEYRFEQPVTIDVARLEEPIAKGQFVKRYTLLGERGDGWALLSQGSTVGYAKLDRVRPGPVKRVRVLIDTVVPTSSQLNLRLYHTQ